MSETENESFLSSLSLTHEFTRSESRLIDLEVQFTFSLLCNLLQFHFFFLSFLHLEMKTCPCCIHGKKSDLVVLSGNSQKISEATYDL